MQDLRQGLRAEQVLCPQTEVLLVPVQEEWPDKPSPFPAWRLFASRGNAHGSLKSRWGTLWIADVHRGNVQRFVVLVDEKVTAVLEVEAAIRAYGKSA